MAPYINWKKEFDIWIYQQQASTGRSQKITRSYWNIRKTRSSIQEGEKQWQAGFEEGRHRQIDKSVQ